MSGRSSEPDGLRPAAIRTAVIYLVVGVLWILLSDRLLLLITNDPEMLTRLSTIKGWFYVTASAVLIFLLINRDLSVIDRRGRDLARSEEYFRHIVETSLDGIWRLDGEGKVVYANARMAQMLGYQPEELLGKSLFSMLFDEDRQAVEARWREQERGGKIRVESRLRRSDGSEVWLMVGSVPLMEEGKFRGVLAMLSDITERKMMEQETDRLVLRLQEADYLKKEFIALAAHELRTPLTPVRGALDLLAEERLGPLNEEQFEALALARRQSRRMQKMVEELLDLSRLDRIEFKLDMQDVDLAKLVAESLEGWRESFGRKGLSLEADIKSDLPLLRGDPLRLGQMLDDLLDNALQFTESGGVTIRLSRLGGWAMLEVQDSGRGIEPTQLEHIFEPFFRLEPSDKGTGLGLTIVRRIAEAHGGRVWAESGGTMAGSVFKVLLPLDGSVVSPLPEPL